VSEMTGGADGAITMAVGVEDRHVVVKFHRPTEFIRFEPKNAQDIAEAITTAAFQADTSLKPVAETLKATLVQKHRDILIPRMMVMLNSMREKKTMSNGQLAMAMMDAFCHEVFP